MYIYIILYIYIDIYTYIERIPKKSLDKPVFAVPAAVFLPSGR